MELACDTLGKFSISVVVGVDFTEEAMFKIKLKDKKQLTMRKVRSRPFRAEKKKVCTKAFNI